MLSVSCSSENLMWRSSISCKKVFKNMISFADQENGRNVEFYIEIPKAEILFQVHVRYYSWEDLMKTQFKFVCSYPLYQQWIPLPKVAVTYQLISSAYACVWRLFIIRCHTLMHVGSTSGGGWASVQSTVSYALVRRNSLRAPRNFMHAQKLSAYADVRPVRSEDAMHTLCERSTRPRHGRRTLTERPQYADVGGHKRCQFNDEPSACW